jgi:hypothetical protein
MNNSYKGKVYFREAETDRTKAIKDYRKLLKLMQDYQRIGRDQEAIETAGKALKLKAAYNL